MRRFSTIAALVGIGFLAVVTSGRNQDLMAALIGLLILLTIVSYAWLSRQRPRAWVGTWVGGIAIYTAGISARPVLHTQDKLEKQRAWCRNIASLADQLLDVAGIELNVEDYGSFKNALSSKLNDPSEPRP
jgi:hypothetical protein